MRTLPAHHVPYKKTPIFTERTIPAGLLKHHTTKAGAWGKIVVLRGSLRYRILAPEVEEILLTPGLSGIVEPEVPHELCPVGPVEFFVEFYREPSDDA